MLDRLTGKLMAREDLALAEAEGALESILKDAPDAAIGSFLTALTLKGETPTEIAGFASVMRRRAKSIRFAAGGHVDTAGTGGGAETFNISTTAAFVIAGAGVVVAKHGNRAVTSRSGSADLLEALGVCIEASPQVAEKALTEVGITFMFAPLFHPAMKRVAAIRRQLAHRTIFNLLGPLTNPAAAPFQLIGVYSAEAASRVAAALRILGCRKAWVVHSEDGLDELSCGAANHLLEVTDTAVTERRLLPGDYGFAPASLSDYPAGTAEENATLVENVLRGVEKGPCREVVILNAAAAIHVATELSFQEAVDSARQSLGSGAAWERVQQLSQFYRDHQAKGESNA